MLTYHLPLTTTTTRLTSYRLEFDRLKELRSSLEAQTEVLAVAKRDQIDAFEAWCALKGFKPSAPGATGPIQAFYGAASGTGWGEGAEEGDEEELDPAETFERLQMAR